MSTHEHTIVVERPVRVVYDQWTQFEDYPAFMDNVENVRQLTPSMTRWTVKVGGVRREYDAAITHQRPDEVIAWHTVDGPDQGGIVSFASVDAQRTQVTLRLVFQPDGVTETVGDGLGVVSATVEHSLDRFKDFIENHAVQTGAWRGTIEGGGRAGTDTHEWLAGQVTDEPGSGGRA
jgi:uncharacterized membrane protein